MASAIFRYMTKSLLSQFTALYEIILHESILDGRSLLQASKKST